MCTRFQINLTVLAVQVLSADSQNEHLHLRTGASVERISRLPFNSFYEPGDSFPFNPLH
jgi:hypothetical protein